MVKRIAFAMVVALLPLEGVARLWVHFDPMSNVWSSMVGSDDPNLLYSPRPGAQVDRVDTAAERYNSLGMRGPEPDLSKPTVLVIGDSVTHGFRLREEDTYPRQVERALGGRATVMNAGVCGYQPWNERARLRQVDAMVRADTVVLQWCQNDKWKGVESTAVPEVSRRADALIRGIEPSPVGLLAASRYVVALREAGRIRREVEANPPPLRWDGEWQDAYLSLLLDAKRDGRRVVALIMPSQARVESGAVVSDPEPEGIARLAGVEVVDPIVALRDAGADSWVDPIHPNGRGMAAVARELAAVLR